jgi:ABC-type transport system involved in multi-copper enzyme maturation permease subunit
MYVVIILLMAMLGVAASADVYGLGGVVKYLKDIGLLLAWVFGWGLAVMTASREIPGEESRGTIFSLIAKPVRRADILLGKWLGAWTLTMFAVATFYGLVVGAVAVRGGALSGLALVQGYVLHAVCLSVVSALAILFSTRTHTDAAATLSAVVSTAAFLVVPRIPEFQHSAGRLQAAMLEILYHLLPHLEVFDMRLRIVHDVGPLSTAHVLQIVAYGASLTALFLLAAWAAFRTKRFSRGDFAA